MNAEDFKSIRKQIFTNCENLTEKKGHDYTKGNVDVLINFKEGGEDLGMTSYQTLGVLMKKHIDAIYNFIKTDGKHQSEPIESRIEDAINYLIFLYALKKESEQQ
jgi:hypothetical protein